MEKAPQRKASATLIAVLAATCGLLSACASTPQADALPSPGAVATAGTDAQVSMTGSRIPARRTEKMLSQVGGKDYRETAAAQPAPLTSN